MINEQLLKAASRRLGYDAARQRSAPPHEAPSRSAVKKEANYWTELLGHLNPLNLYGGALAGNLAALATKTRDTRDQAEWEEWGGKPWMDILVPGVAPYNAAKRLGHSIRSPDLKRERRQVRREKDREEGEDRRAPAGDDQASRPEQSDEAQKAAWLLAHSPLSR